MKTLSNGFHDSTNGNREREREIARNQESGELKIRDA
jgi:hypothetical protein